MNTPAVRLAFCGLLALAAAPAIFADDATVPPAAPAAAPASEEKAPVPAAVAPAPAADLEQHVADLKRELAEAEDKLSTALRSYTLLQTESDRVKAEADARLQASEAAAEKTLAETKAAAARAAEESAAQVTALSDELRQTQAQANALAAEVSQLKTRLALSGPPPGTTLASPTRPGTVLAPQPVAPAAPDPTPADGPRRHVVVAGDSLAKISQRYYGTTSRWDEIFRANRDILQNENLLPVGASLRIP